MTTTVKKGSGRAAATARRTKAAQKDVWLDEAVAAGKPTQAKPSKASGNREVRPESHPERREDSGPGKAARLTAALRPAGWTVKTKTQGERVEATARRKQETLVMVFVRGAYDYGASSLSDGDRTRKVRNVSEAIRICSQVEA